MPPQVPNIIFHPAAFRTSFLCLSRNAYKFFKYPWIKRILQLDSTDRDLNPKSQQIFSIKARLWFLDSDVVIMRVLASGAFCSRNVNKVSLTNVSSLWLKLSCTLWWISFLCNGLVTVSWPLGNRPGSPADLRISSTTMCGLVPPMLIEISVTGSNSSKETKLQIDSCLKGL